MIIFLSGPDSYRRQKRLRELATAYQKKYPPVDLLEVDLEDNPENWLRVKGFLTQPSIFEATKIVIVKEADSVLDKEWLKLLRQELKTTKNFVFISNNSSPSKDFEFLTKKPVFFEKFDDLNDNQLDLFFKKEADRRHLVFSPSAWLWWRRFLKQQAEGIKSWLIVNELEKLALADFPQPISLTNLKSIIFWFFQENLYFLADKFWRANTIGEKLMILEYLFLQKQPSAYLFNLLAYRPPQAKIQKLAADDVLIKSGHLDYEEALLDLALI